MIRLDWQVPAVAWQRRLDLYDAYFMIEPFSGASNANSTSGTPTGMRGALELAWGP